MADDNTYVSPDVEDANVTITKLRASITWQQTRALNRIADNEAQAGDVALVLEMARAIVGVPERAHDEE